MHVIPLKWRRASARLLRGLAAPALLASGGTILAAEPAPLAASVTAVPAPTQAPVLVPDVRSARHLALEHQPTVKAARASLAAANTRRYSLDKLGISGLLARDLATRKQQSDLGIQAATAAVQQAEVDAVFAVTYCYLAYEYASMQEALAADAVERVQVLSQVIKDSVKAGKRLDVFPEQGNLANAMAKVVEGRHAEAKAGKQRALAALREAIGLDSQCVIVVPDRELPELKADLTRDSIVSLALARRGEVTMANAGAEVTFLEICAQKKTFLPTARTYAAGSDLHYIPLPAASLGTTYRPGALTIEMPTMFAGPRNLRIEQATELSARADAVAEKTKGLITLEAEDAFLRWHEMGIVAASLAIAGKDADKYYDKLQQRFQIDPEKKGIDNPTIEDLVNAGAAVGKLKADANEARFNYLISLALLERVTGGGVCVDFDQPAPKSGK